MRVFISTTPPELEPCREAAVEVVRDLGLEPVLRDPVAARGLDPVSTCARQVAAADLLLAIVGWRPAAAPPPELGGDGLRPWTSWEVQSAFDHQVPVVVLMAGDSWRPRTSEDLEGRALMQDFRGELHRLAVFFDRRPDDASDAPEGFRELVREQLGEARQGALGTTFSEPSLGGLTLRRASWPKWPERPYPVLLPVTHPELLGGREEELAELRRRLASPVPILGLYAASGTGKSSLLAGGLVPAVRAEGRPVAFDRYPCEAGIAGRLLGDLLQTADEASGLAAVADGDPGTFVDHLRLVHRLQTQLSLGSLQRTARTTPVLVLDQLDDLFRPGATRRARAVVGTLLAATVQRLPGLDGPPCRWLLAYREELHGEVVEWLGDVLRDARAEGIEAAATLPHDLSGPDRFHGLPLPPLGTPPPGSRDRPGAATRAFLAAIERPLGLETPEGRPRYPWRFAAGDAERLARAFAKARLERPEAPLVPELQVVLAHLLARAGEPSGDEPVRVEVPEEPGELIDQALEQHLRRALDDAFPLGPDPETQGHRTRALLALRELAEVRGRPGKGLPAELLARAIGAEGRGVLERLATPQTRLVVLEEQADAGWCYVLSHDRLAEVLIRLVDDAEAYAGLGFDAKLLGLRRFVALQSELYDTGETEQATEVDAARFKQIAANTAALLWGDGQRRWWRACQERRRADQRRRRIRQAIATVVVALVFAGAWTWADRRAHRRALLGQVAEGEPEAAFAALARRPDADAPEWIERWRQRPEPLDVLEHGLGGVAEKRRGTAVLEVAELAMEYLVEEHEDPEWIASLVWAVDYATSRDPALAERGLELRNAVLAPLRRHRPPPPWPPPGDPDWVDVPGGTFLMGTAEGEHEDFVNVYLERPQGEVTVSPFRLLRHEVTNAEYRRLFPEHAGADEWPAGTVSWNEAYTYAAWLGGRLPTEAEWEYAARAGCPWEYCTADGRETTVDAVAWSLRNSRDPVTGEVAARPVMRLEPNPWGLYDMLGNLWELVADWHGPYPGTPRHDPPGPPQGLYRAARGGGFVQGDSAGVRAAYRTRVLPEDSYFATGFRVMLPVDPPSADNSSEGSTTRKPRVP